VFYFDEILLELTISSPFPYYNATIASWKIFNGEDDGDWGSRNQTTN
jgi:hypothetical protein